MIRDILLLQKRELEKRLQEKYVPRELELSNMHNDLIKVIIGPRRAGKSFFAIHMLNKLGSFGYVNFDDENLIGLKNYDEIVSLLGSIYKKPECLLIDEIQNLSRWELFANRLQRQGYNLVLTGSNSNLLSKELATHLTGRHIALVLFPFSFKEYLNLTTEELTENETKEKFFSYIHNGGYPEPLVKSIDYKEYLATLFNSILYKDIVKRFRIRAVQGMEDLAVYLISNVAKEFSYNTLTQVTKCKSVHTVEKYLKYMEEAFIFFKLTRFSFKYKEQAASNKKIYCVDNGFISSKAFKLSPDIGKLYENVVAIELKKLEMQDNTGIYYWKSLAQEEVDFVVKDDEGIRQLIQVCQNIDEPKTKEREVRALVKASKELGCNNLLVLTESYEAEEQVNWFGIKRKIRFTPVWKWLLRT